MRVAYDIDGVLTCTPFGLEELDEMERSPLQLPDGFEKYIISSRPEVMREKTEIWLEKEGIDYEELILSSDGSIETTEDGRVSPESQAEFKAKAIRENNIEVYVEDNPDVVKLLKRKCPSCSILYYSSYNDKT